MKIIYTLPSISTPHGGYRIVLEHLTRLQARGHDVKLFIQTGITNTDWYGKVDFDIIKKPAYLRDKVDVIVLGSPHGMVLNTNNNRKVCFVQMTEHLFKPSDRRFGKLCKEWYESPYDKFYGSAWIAKFLKGKLHYLIDGINTDHFPVENRILKLEKIALVEGWESTNAAKDVDRLGQSVAAILKHKYGFQVHAYGHTDVPRLGRGTNPANKILDQYYYRPDLSEINDLYRRSTILLKASQYDSRALSPMEAATKECLTVRALREGDDNLVHGVNCLRTEYAIAPFLQAAEVAAEMGWRTRADLLNNFVIQPWEPIIDELEQKLLNV